MLCRSAVAYLTIPTKVSQVQKNNSDLGVTYMSIYNCKVTDYGDSLHIEYFHCPIKRTVKEKENTISSVIKKQIINDMKKSKNAEKSTMFSVNRSKRNLYYIARSNKWDFFITLTFNRHDTDASNYDEVSKKVRNWLNNIKKRASPDFKYLVVPELHNDGINYHFHGLIANIGNLDISDSGKIDRSGKVIYNLPLWRWGFSTATKIESNERVTNYLGKYITKDLMNRLKNKKRYYCSQNVNFSPVYEENINRDDLYDYFEADKIKSLKTIGTGFNRITYIEVEK